MLNFLVALEQLNGCSGLSLFYKRSQCTDDTWSLNIDCFVSNKSSKKMASIWKNCGAICTSVALVVLLLMQAVTPGNARMLVETKEVVASDCGFLSACRHSGYVAEAEALNVTKGIDSYQPTIPGHSPSIGHSIPPNWELMFNFRQCFGWNNHCN